MYCHKTNYGDGMALKQMNNFIKEFTTTSFGENCHGAYHGTCKSLMMMMMAKLMKTIAAANIYRVIGYVVPGRFILPHVNFLNPLNHQVRKCDS